MIIACPACSTRYVVPDSAIGIEGRTVRCAKCRHSWFEEGSLPVEPSGPASPGWQVTEPEPTAPAAPTAPTAPTATAEESAEPAPPPLPDPAPAVSPPPVPPLVERPAAHVYADEPADRPLDRARGEQDWSSFDHEPPFRPRRNRLRMWTMAAAGFALAAVGAIGAVAWYGMPDWMPFARPTFAETPSDLVLDFPPNRQDRRVLPNGTVYFGASGKVTNVGSTRRPVPPIRIILRDSRERIVYSWEVAAPKRQLNPGESVTINEAVTDVPRSAKYAEIGWKPI